MREWLLSLLRPARELCARHPKWREVRAAHLIIEPACQFCGGKASLEVHHIYPVGWPDGRATELSHDNLITLCEANGCHFAIGHLRAWTSRNHAVREWCAARKARPYPERL